MNKKANETTGQVSRRDFIKTSAAVSLAAMGAGTNRIFAAGSDKIRIALIGCGGRGNGALKNCIDAAKQIGREIEVVATADWFESKAQKTAQTYGVPNKRCFSGADAYKNLLETHADLVLMATSPNFRPVHFEAAIKAGKHVFMEKPVAVDPPGVRRVIEAGELAKSKGLAVVAGTQRRHQVSYLQTKYAVENGAIGKIRGGCIWWCGRIPWIHRRKPEYSDADYMVDNWLNFVEMSGDHIVEQHLHNLDVANWFIGHPPIRAIGFGGRARRETGNQFDFFSIQYDYADDIHIHSMCRKVSDCWNRVSEHFVGSDGSTFGDGSSMEAGKKVDIPQFAGHEDPYVQEHIDLLNSIIEGKPINEARNVAESTMTAIMGRISAYTGQAIRWSDLAETETSPWYNFTLKPTAEEFETGKPVAPPDDVIPIPGSPYEPKK
jgi:predicted dehydrogenase